MNPPKALMLLLISAFCFGCKDQNSGKQYGVIEDKSETFRVGVELVLPKDDFLQLYYTTDGSTQFTDRQSVWVQAKGSPKKQKVVLSLPPQVKPSQLRLDFGKNKAQQNINLEHIRLSYRGKFVEFPGTLIFSYFRPDVTKTQFDARTATISGLTVGGKKQSPSLYPKGPLSEELAKLLE